MFRSICWIERFGRSAAGLGPPLVLLFPGPTGASAATDDGGPRQGGRRFLTDGAEAQADRGEDVEGTGPWMAGHMSGRDFRNQQQHRLLCSQFPMCSLFSACLIMSLLQLPGLVG